jgi:hypothetical protein
MPKLALLSSLVFLSSSCVSLLNRDFDAVYLRELEAPLRELRAGIGAAVPLGLRGLSPNGREMFSKHFVVVKERYKPAADALERYYAHITILGDRRPYDVEILVVQEKRVLRGNRFTYVIAGYARDLAQALEQDIRKELSKRREDRNVVDDFRVY